MEVAEMTGAIFAPHLNSGFRVQMAPNQVVEMTLVTVTDKGSSPEMESFILNFLAPPDAPIRQGTYRMGHDILGEFDLFIVPIGRDARGVTYEAVFVRGRRPAKSD
ncbi:MAG: DUF6916 family protein [Candidatus Binataceae bacterium]